MIQTPTQATILGHRDELRRLGVKSTGLFGSHLQGTAQDDSDVDLLIDLARPSFDDYMDVKFLLEDLFGRRVDLVTEGRWDRRCNTFVMKQRGLRD